MGSIEDDLYAKPVHEVCLDGFWMGRTEVTQGQWKALMGSNPSKTQKVDLPVESVSWQEAKIFVDKLNRRQETGGFGLPTEAQW